MISEQEKQIQELKLEIESMKTKLLYEKPKEKHFSIPRASEFLDDISDNIKRLEQLQAELDRK